MWRRFIIAVTLAAATGGSLWAQSRSLEVQFKAAQEKEEVEGDLKGAIKEYEKIVSGSNRELAAQALLRIADIHARLGNAEANKVYERLIRDFKEQNEAVSIARARLGRATDTQRRDAGRRFIPMPELQGLLVKRASMSSDGRYIAYINQTGGQTVVLRDLRTGRERRVSPTATGKGNYVSFPLLSKDGRQLAYLWATQQSSDLRVANLEESGVPRFRKLLDDRYVQPYDWTPDGKSIVVAMAHHDETADISLVAVSDGSRRVLHVMEQGEGWRSMFISPDGRYLARDRQTSDPPRHWDISLLPLSGGAAIPIVNHPANDGVVGWSPDGHHLLFTSDRGTGTLGLYALNVGNGRAQDPRPTLITANIGTLPTGNAIYSFGVTKTGALFYAAADPADLLEIQEVEIATFNVETGVMGPGTVVGTDRPGLNSAPAWSRDGKKLAYRSAPTSTAQPSILIRSLDTDTTHELRTGLPGLSRFDWSPDGRFLLTETTAVGGGIYRIDAETGAVSPLVSGSNNSWARWSPDGRSVYYRRIDADGTVAFIARDLAAGTEREIIRRPHLGALHLSPDGRYIATGSDDAAANSRAIMLIPVAGGEARVLRVNQPRDGGVGLWAPDSRSVIVRSSPTEVWRVPLDGPPVRLANDLPLSSAPALHPDGTRVAVVQRSAPSTSQFQMGVRVLENFLPKASK